MTPTIEAGRKARRHKALGDTVLTVCEHGKPTRLTVFREVRLGNHSQSAA